MEMFVFNFKNKYRYLAKEALGRNALIMGDDERTLRAIIPNAQLEREDQIIYRKLDFIFKDAAPNTN